jgi:hypothetical protein
MKIDTVQLNITLGRKRQEQNKTNQNKTRQNKVAVADQGDNYNIASYRTKIPGHISWEFQTFIYSFDVSWGGGGSQRFAKTWLRNIALYFSPRGALLHHKITERALRKLGNFWEKNLCIINTKIT